MSTSSRNTKATYITTVPIVTEPADDKVVRVPALSSSSLTPSSTQGPVIVDVENEDLISWCKRSASTVAAARKRFRFHVLGLVHLPVSRRYDACAFTQKIVKLCRMLLAAGHEVILYGAQGSDADLYTSFVQTHTLRSIREAFGNDNHPDLDSSDPDDIGYDWRRETFRTDFGEPKPCTYAFYGACIGHIGSTMKPDDFLLMSMGTHHKPVADAVRLYLAVEPGIGYYGSWSQFRAFESTAAYHYMLKAVSPKDNSFVDGKFYWRTVPNYYDVADFDVAPDVAAADPDGAIANRGKYFLFMARLITRKGFHVIVDLCKRLDLPLWICGQGYQDYDAATGKLTLQEGNVTVQLSPKMRYLGYADAKRRAYLMTNARATMCFTLFTEPFCGVNVESQLCGTPVITTNYGAFVDTVEQGKTGYRCDTTNDIALAVAEVGRLDRQYIKDRARRLYSLESVQWMFEKFWQDLYDVYLSTVKNADGSPAGRGFGEIRPEVLEYVEQAKRDQSFGDIGTVPTLTSAPGALTDADTASSSSSSSSQ